MLKIVADQLIQEQDVIIYPGIMADQMVQEHTLYTSYMLQQAVYPDIVTDILIQEQDVAHSDTAYKLIQECNMIYIIDHDKRIKTWCQNKLQDVTHNYKTLYLTKV